MKKTMNIKLRSVSEVKEFVEKVGNIEGDVTASSGLYRVDAKSLVGIWVLDIGAPLYLEIAKWKDEYDELLQPYLLQAR